MHLWNCNDVLRSFCTIPCNPCLCGKPHANIALRVHHAHCLGLCSAADTVYLVHRPGQTQASIATGEVGINILDPDACALDILGDIFNGFGGRLFDELRSREVRL